MTSLLPENRAHNGPYGPHAPLARAVLAAAEEVEAAETRLKREILARARAGDCGGVITLVEQWLYTPPSEVVATHLIDASDLR